MAGESKDVGRDIAKLALADALYDSSTLEKVFAYCFEQLCWRKTETELLAIIASLKMEE
jgi:hypothetical protein